jgi:hypothetical protein
MMWRARSTETSRVKAPPRHRRTHPIAAVALVTCSVILGVGGMVGGIVFLIDPTGRALGMSTRLLQGTPVANYLLPGLFILLAFGILPMVVAYGLIARPHWGPFDWVERRTGDHWSWLGAVVVAVTLIAWIGLQISLIGLEAPIQVVCGGLGLLMLVLAMLPPVRRFYAGT